MFTKGVIKVQIQIWGSIHYKVEICFKSIKANTISMSNANIFFKSIYNSFKHLKK